MELKSKDSLINSSVGSLKTESTIISMKIKIFYGISVDLFTLEDGILTYQLRDKKEVWDSNTFPINIFIEVNFKMESSREKVHLKYFQVIQRVPKFSWHTKDSGRKESLMDSESTWMKKTQNTLAILWLDRKQVVQRSSQRKALNTRGKF